MDWDENKKDRLYALLCGKLEEIRDGPPLPKQARTTSSRTTDYDPEYTIRMRFI